MSQALIIILIAFVIAKLTSQVVGCHEKSITVIEKCQISHHQKTLSELIAAFVSSIRMVLADTGKRSENQVIRGFIPMTREHTVLKIEWLRA